MSNYTQEDIDNAVDEKTSEMQKKIEQLESQLSRFAPETDDPFGPTWKPETAQDMGRDILAAVEKKFPDMAKKQQDSLAEAVIAKMDERKEQTLEQQKKEENAKLQAQIDYIKETDKDFDEKQMWDFLKEYKGEQPKTVAEAYQTFKQEYKEPEPQIDEGKPQAEGTQKPANPVPQNLDKAMQEGLQELGIDEY